MEEEGPVKPLYEQLQRPRSLSVWLKPLHLAAAMVIRVEGMAPSLSFHSGRLEG